MNKLTSLRIKYKDGTYSDQIPIGAFAENIKWDNTLSLKDILGQINFKKKGSIQKQIDEILIQKIDQKQLSEYVNNQLAEDTTQWLNDNVVPAGSVVVLDNGLTIEGAAADAKAVGDQLKQIKDRLNNASIDVNDLGLYQDSDTGYVYPTYRDEISQNGIPLAASGGGGGGGDIVSAILNVTNATGWLSKTIASGSDCDISLVWSSTEDGMPTGDGNIRISVNDVVRTTYQISQGNVFVNLAPYLATGTNKVKVRISDTYDQGKTITFNITSIALSITSTFDSSTVYSSAISFPYTPVGAVEKTVYFILDGQTIGTQTIQASNRQMSYTIPTQSHGAHSLRVYFESTINNETVRSNELYYEFLFVDQLSTTPIIASSFSATSMPQYSTIALPFLVYTPATLTSNVTISANGTVVSTQTVDRTEQSFSYKANQYGTLTFVISTGKVSKTISLTITESEIDVKAETEDLALYLSSQGRSNAESTRNVWTYGDGVSQIACTLSGFNWVSDGWQTDDDNATLLRVSGNARVTIPYKPFAQDFRTTGKTIELEFATRNVLDYDATILSCMSGGKGLELTPQKATLKSEQSEISVQYKENEHIRVTFVVEKRAENRLVFVFINSIPSGVIEYPTNDDFSQISPVNISIGSNDATIDLYCIRVYDNDLTRHQVLDNWIADTTDGSEMLDRYSRNNVYDAYGNITIANLPSYIPYFILDADELPQYKGDKKTITGTYTDPMYPSKSFTFTGCQINVQGTSSAPYARKNYDMQFKNGFELTSGHANQYALRTGAIPFNRFVLKADVASSEGANNVELVRLYNDACPYKTPEMVEDSRVRWGIDGFPIVVFWNDTATGTVKFLGKYNFNLPKRAPAPYGYSKEGTMESWEFQNNRDALMLFQSDYFNMEMRTDPDTGETKEVWRFDYEARFPSDEWTDISILQEFQTFVYSTWRQNAPNTALPASVTYGGVTYTTDNADYRLAKFKNEFPTYAELDSFIFYYIFTEQFLMVDSRAKNLFIGFNGSPVTVSGRKATRKATAQPYDMDTAIGTNNEGSLVNSYNVEDADYGGVYTGEGSVLWENVRDAFNTEIVQMYQSLRSQGILSFDTVETRFEEHQSIWPEAIWLEDSWFKYIDPLINPDTGKQPTSMYLPMMQGSKEQQRKWWLSNRFRYQDSRWHCGDALLSPIQLRAYSKGNITVTPYFDIYATVRYGTPIITQRSTHGQATTLVCPSEVTTFYDTEIYIYSAQQIASVGDLSPLKVGLADFSGAINLQEVKLGDSSSSYNNDWLYQLSFGSNRLLKKIDVRNCAGLGNTNIEGHTQTTVDISGCEVIEEVYFDGTNIKGLTLPNGGVLKVLHLPSTITNLTILNQIALTDLSVPSYSNISTLRLENIPIVDTKMVINNIPANTRVRLIGFTWEVTGAEEIEAILDRLDTMRGLDESGGNMDKAQVSGTIKVATLAGSQIASYKERYPYITIDAENVSSTVTYKTYDGSSIITTETVVKDAAHPAPDATYSGKPSRTSTAQYSYTFAGWSTSPNGSAEANAQKNIQGDRVLYAAYTATVRTYNVYFYNGSTLLQTRENVPYGGSASYTGATPVNPQDPTLDFISWNPAPINIVGNTSCYAQFESPVKEIEDSWTQIGNAIDDGSYKTKYKVGWYKPLNLGNQGVVNMQIVAMDEDVLTAGGTAPLTFVGKELLNTSHRMKATSANIDGWAETQMRKTYLPNTILPLINSVVRMRIQEVNKTYYDKTTNSTLTSSDKLWIPSAREIFGGTSYEDSGVIYSTVFKDDASRKKHKANSASNNFYWLRSAYSSNDAYFRVVISNGGVSNSNASGASGVCLGFCLGNSSEINDTEITDSWDTIIWNIDNKTYQKYDIGQYKPLDLGTQGIINMQIVAVDEDVSPNGDTIPLTFIGKELLNTSHRMKATNTNIDGWAETQMRSYLTNTIKPLIPSDVAKRICTVNKTYYNRTAHSTLISEDKLWIPSGREISGGTTYENSGSLYTAIFKDDASRKKHKANSASNNFYWLRSARSWSGTSFRSVNGDGYVSSDNAGTANGVCLGFCLGYEQQTIEDDWSTILSQLDPSSKYSLGDTKSLSINGTDHLMQIVAFNSDEMTAGGTAKITWVEKDLFTNHRMNATGTNENGWAATQMRSWLRETILPTISEIVRNKIVEVNKTYYDKTTSSTLTQADTVWIPSAREIFGGTSYEDSGVNYTTIFKNATSRIKKYNDIAQYYWLRSANSSGDTNFRNVNSYGYVNYYDANNASGVCVAFCTN